RGPPAGPAQIVSSTALALAAMIRAAGGEPLDLGIARDERAAILALVDAAAGCDLLVTLGGASVGEHDLVQKALSERGLALDFWKIAMRPGKPLMFGRLGAMPMLGFPGNPVSSIVCGLLFLKPAIAALLGLKEPPRPAPQARLGRDLPENDGREDYMRASLTHDEAGMAVATPFNRQDSSNLSKLAEARCLVIRPPRAPAAKAGEMVTILPLDDF
ncbi:MAG: molybdopterin molybdotransferase MoeA, partial [Alphaproteobacteria bacterium]|nr:molybdopterin molybdotransferase MoeA [Alphaproteobacteria bacterium]